MNSHASAIAAKLQGAHERRTRGEDTRMSKEEIASVWDDDPYLHAMKLAARLNMVLGSLAHRGHAPDAPQATDQASAVSAERVVELERRLVQSEEDRNSGANAYRQLERLAEERTEGLTAAQCRIGELNEELEELRADLLATHELLATAYVVREVPWADVAAGMMTIARDGTPWMVGAVHDDGRVALRNADQSFTKAPTYGETVRVLVPYVTPEQAESLVKDGLGGTAVS